MSAFEKVLWALDNEIQPAEFERLCVDLLCREGYRRIEPGGGTKDLGKDAELSFWSGLSDLRLAIAFQFSLEKNWEKKLVKDEAKIANNFKNVQELVFVTPQRITGTKKDKLKSEARKTYNWELTIYDREWLRNRLCEYHQDLAKKYLGLDLPTTVGLGVTQLELCEFDEKASEGIFLQTSPEMLRATIVEQTRKEPRNISHWYNLARFDFLRRNYDSALEAINQALGIPTEDQVLSLNLNLRKGVILAEKGVATHSRPLLIQAKEIFTFATTKIKRAQDLYNLANVLSVLGELDEARELYEECLKLKPGFAQAWKNYGSVFVAMEQPEKGIECFDKAIAIEARLVEAHLSKATAYLLHLKKPKDAIECFEMAYAIMPGLDRKWDQGKYFLSRALQMDGRLEDALKQVETGLASRPGDRYMLNQKASVLRHLRKQNPAFEEKSLEFSKFRAQAFPADFQSLVEIIEIFTKQESQEAAWKFIDINLPCSPLSLSRFSSRASLSIQDLKTGFEHARFYASLRRHLKLDDYYILLRNAGLSPDRDLLDMLDFALMVPFGRMLDGVRSAQDKKGIPPMQTFFLDTLETVAMLWSSAGGYLLAATKPVTEKDQIDLLSRGMACLSDIVASETSRIYGFIAGKYCIPNDAVDKGREVAWNDILGKAATKLMVETFIDWEMAVKNLKHNHKGVAH